MLEEDAMRFDAFLKENDYKGVIFEFYSALVLILLPAAVEAIRKAEQETKAKQANLRSMHHTFPPPLYATASLLAHSSLTAF